jgi:hypothetical protein
LEKTAESNSSNAKRALRSNTSIVSKPLALPHSDEDSSEDEVQRMLATASAKKKTLSTPIGAKTATTSRTPAPAPAPASASAKDSNTKPVQEKMKNDSKVSLDIIVKNRSSHYHLIAAQYYCSIKFQQDCTER